MWKNNNWKNVIVKTAINGASTPYIPLKELLQAIFLKWILQIQFFISPQIKVPTYINQIYCRYVKDIKIHVYRFRNYMIIEDFCR